MKAFTGIGQILMLAASLTMCNGQGTLQGVVAGYVLDHKIGSLRPLLGIPGANRLGDPLDLPFKIQTAAVSDSIVLAVSTERPSVYLLSLQDGSAAIHPVGGALRNIDRIVMNSGTAALLFSSTEGSFQFLTHLDRDPQVSAPIPLTFVRGAVSAAAVNEAGTCAAIAAIEETTSFVERVCMASPSLSLVAQLPDAAIRDLKFINSDRDLVALDESGNRILLFDNFSFGGAPIVLSTADDGVDQPSSLIALDEASIAVLQQNSLLVVSQGRKATPQSIRLPMAPTAPSWFARSGILLLNELTGDPLSILDTRQQFATYFVPLPQSR